MLLLGSEPPLRSHPPPGEAPWLDKVTNLFRSQGDPGTPMLWCPFLREVWPWEVSGDWTPSRPGQGILGTC